MPERTTYLPSTFCWVELATSDTAGAERFYTQLFGWVGHGEPSPTASGTCKVLELDGRRVAGLHERALGSDVGPHWASFVSVENADDSARKAERAGGKIVRPPVEVGDLARTAVLADPSGAQFHVWQPRAHEGAAVVNEPGAFCWNELATDDTAACRAFYVAVFGWTPLTTLSDKTEYTTFKRGDAPLCGMLNMPVDWPVGATDGSRNPTRPTWMTYFAVADCFAAAERAKELGGRLLVKPTEIPPVGRFAVIQDPQGAVFSIVEQTETA